MPTLVRRDEPANDGRVLQDLTIERRAVHAEDIDEGEPAIHRLPDVALVEVDAVPPRQPGSVVLVDCQRRCLHHAELGIPLIPFPLTDQLGRDRFLCRRQELQHGQGTASVESSGEVEVRQIPTPSATTAQLQEGRVRRIKGQIRAASRPPGNAAQQPSPRPRTASSPAGPIQPASRGATASPPPSGQNSDIRTGASPPACRPPTRVCTATGLAADPSQPAMVATRTCRGG
jgi:hypothetical protein